MQVSRKDEEEEEGVLGWRETTVTEHVPDGVSRLGSSLSSTNNRSVV